MELYLDAGGRAEISGAAASATVQDLLDAVDRFLARCPLPCAACGESCCQKPWAVAVDNVAAGRLCGCPGARCRYAKERCVLRENIVLEIDHYVLDKSDTDGRCPFVSPDNRCAEYASRPLICRLYFCLPAGPRYEKLSALASGAFWQALAQEAAGGGRNPALGAADYALPLGEVLRHAQSEGWIGAAEARTLLDDDADERK